MRYEKDLVDIWSVSGIACAQDGSFMNLKYNTRALEAGTLTIYIRFLAAHGFNCWAAQLGGWSKNYSNMMYSVDRNYC